MNQENSNWHCRTEQKQIENEEREECKLLNERACKGMNRNVKV